jgi:hypothetical protein
VLYIFTLACYDDFQGWRIVALSDAALAEASGGARVRDHRAGLPHRHLGRLGADRAGADIIIIDDPLKPEEALSQTQRRAANEWYDHTLYSRLNDKLTGAIVLIMHRLHEDDLAGHVLAQESWEVVRLPANADEDELHRAATVFGCQSFSRKAGEALHSEREPPEMLEQIRRTLGEYNFAGQYQQMPSPQGGGMVKAAWFRSYAANERPKKFDRIVQSWDTASKASELSDFSVCTSWGILDKDLYLIDVLRPRMEYPS